MAYKINLHITQKCNYACKYCFAHFDSDNDLTLAEWKHIIDNLKTSGLVNAINFAGGEPVLHKDFSAIVNYAYDQGFKLSIITNGSLMLNPKLMPPELFGKFETLGISVDSINPQTLVALGACNRSHEVLIYEKLSQLITLARSVNPDIKIKLNTVITNLNANEDLTVIGKEFGIDRWKMLRMKLFAHEGNSNAALVPSQADFDGFVARHYEVSEDVVPENDLTRSYIMVDNQGQLLDDEGEDYKVVGSLLIENFTEVFGRYAFDENTYASRYVA
ncbi:MAG: radical SAM protein [Selenomonas ruminantium]|nr:radical SAM protein [Selenomonas ruminantium]